MMKKQNAIEVTNMTKAFKVHYDKPMTLKERLVSFRNDKVEYHTVLKDINVEIKKGETVALVGTNGSGKSTLLKLMTRIIYPNEGTVETKGKLTSLLELGAGFHDDFTGRENIYFNAAIFGLSRSEIDARINDIIEFSELGDFIDNPIRTYSSGMYMRLAFSVAINVDAEILLIDEILAVGDQHFQDKCIAKLEELRDSEKTIVIVSHSLEMIKKLCTRAIWIYKGEVRDDGCPNVVIDKYLEQVVLDHEKKISEVQIDKISCFLQVDSPKQGEKVNADYLVVHGWEASDVSPTEVKIVIGDRVYSANRRKRSDVMMTLQDGYGGASLNSQAGFDKKIKIKDLRDNCQVKIYVYYKNKVIAEETRNIEVVGE